MQAISISLQIWSAVIRLGTPGRIKSVKRSSMLKSFNETACKSSQRLRQVRTVMWAIFISRAICELFFPAAAADTMRPRKATCCRDFVTVDQFLYALTFNV